MALGELEAIMRRMSNGQTNGNGNGYGGTATFYAGATVADAMSPGVISCTADTPLRAVARLMATYRVHAVFVLDYGEEADETAELWGLVSDLDLVAAAWAGVDERTAGDSAVAPLVTVRSSDRLERAAQLMAENGVSHLAVLDAATGRPVGVLSTLDIARVIARSADALAGIELEPHGQNGHGVGSVRPRSA
jgi:CBS domain-containing protein